jgi:hypothetical protein
MVKPHRHSGQLAVVSSQSDGSSGVTGQHRASGGTHRATSPRCPASGNEPNFGRSFKFEVSSVRRDTRVTCAKQSQFGGKWLKEKGLWWIGRPDGSTETNALCCGQMRQTNPISTGSAGGPWSGHQDGPTVAIYAGGDGGGSVYGGWVLPAGGRLCHHRGHRVQKHCIRIDIGDVR